MSKPPVVTVQLSPTNPTPTGRKSSWADMIKTTLACLVAVGLVWVFGWLALLTFAPYWTMEFYTNSHNGQTIEQIKHANAWLQSNCNLPKNLPTRAATIQADLDCLDALRLQIDRTDPKIEELETWTPLREITGFGQVDSCGGYWFWQTMSPEEKAENPRPPVCK